MIQRKLTPFSKGSCGLRVDNTTVAAKGDIKVERRITHPHLRCGDEVLIVGLAGTPGTIKTVTDICAKCPEKQLDNFTTASACGDEIGDLGKDKFTTIRLR